MVKGIQRNQSLRRVYILAGESSGDRLAAELISDLKKINPSIEFIGVGGPLMVKEGLTQLFPYEKLHVMGLVEVITHLPELIRFKNTIIDSIQIEQPDLIITVDNQEFSLQVAKSTKRINSSIPIIHYVLPTVWAWRPKRIKKVKQYFDHILYLFPFEEKILSQNQIDGSFVGHPITRIPVPNHIDNSVFEKAMNIHLNQDILLILPGSRKGEVHCSAPVFRSALLKIVDEFPELQPILVMSPNVSNHPMMKPTFWPETVKFFDSKSVPKEMVEEYKMYLFQKSKVAMAMSGTVSLELAATKTPMVIGYDFNNWLTRNILKQLLLVNSVNLVNLVSETEFIPECLGDDFNSKRIYSQIKTLLTDQTAYEKQLSIFELVMKKLTIPAPNVQYPIGEAVSKFFTKVLGEKGNS